MFQELFIYFRWNFFSLCNLQIFYSSLFLVVHSLNSVFQIIESFYFNVVQFIIFLNLWIMFLVFYQKNLCLTLGQKDFLTCCLPAIRLWSILNSFLYIKYGLKLFKKNNNKGTFFQHYFLGKKKKLFPINCFCTFGKNKLSLYAWAYFWTSYRSHKSICQFCG